MLPPSSTATVDSSSDVQVTSQLPEIQSSHSVISKAIFAPRLSTLSWASAETLSKANEIDKQMERKEKCRTAARRHREANRARISNSKLRLEELDRRNMLLRSLVQETTVELQKVKSAILQLVAK